MSKKKQKPVWERGYNGHVYWLGKKKLGKVTVHADKGARHKYTWEAAGRAGSAEDLGKAKQSVEAAAAMADKQLDLFS
jgi:YD repeat-containing protein